MVERLTLDGADGDGAVSMATPQSRSRPTAPRTTGRALPAGRAPFPERPAVALDGGAAPWGPGAVGR